MKILFFAFFLVSCTSGVYNPPQKLTVEMLSVGQGLAFLIRGEKCATLYDTGTPLSRIDTMLVNRGIKELCSVILSHPHNDHTGGMAVLQEMEKRGDLKIGRVLTYNKVLRNDTLSDFLPWTARILWAGNGTTIFDDAEEAGNEVSIVMRISDGKNSFLFMGDLESGQEYSLLQLEPLLDATALQVGHHGSKTSSSWKFLSQIQPKIAFISAGKGNSYGHPHEETLAKLHLILPDSSQIFRTDLEGSTEVIWIYGIGL